MRRPVVRVTIERVANPGHARAEPGHFGALVDAAFQRLLDRNGMPGPSSRGVITLGAVRVGARGTDDGALAESVAEAVWRALGSAR